MIAVRHHRKLIACYMAASMNPPKCCEEDYIQWLIASPRFATCTLAAELSPKPVAHDAYNRLLGRLEPSSDELWNEVQGLISRKEGWLIIDDCTIEKVHSRKMELVTRHWSGNKRAVISGINLITLVWTDGDIAIPVDWRVFNKSKDQLTKNDHARQMLQKAQERGFEPRAVWWDSWYSSLENLKLIRSFKWKFFVAIKTDRIISGDDKIQTPIGEFDFGAKNQKRVYLRGFDFVNAYKYVLHEDDVWYFIGTEDSLSEGEVKQRKEIANKIEQYHRTLKQDCHIQRCQALLAVKQKNHIGLSIRAYVRLIHFSYVNFISTQRLKLLIYADAITNYLKNPRYVLPATA